MKILLDTCTFLWIIPENERLSLHARDLFQEPDNDVYLSSVSAWEIAVKYDLGRLPLPEPPERYIPDQRQKHRIGNLALDEESALYITRLPTHHRDPFDRMLISQCMVHGLILLTPDEEIRSYPVKTAW